MPTKKKSTPHPKTKTKTNKQTYNTKTPQTLQTIVVVFMYFVFTCMPGNSYRRKLRSCVVVASFERSLSPLFVDVVHIVS